MPRDHARINVTIWSDPEFRALPPAAQHLYLALWTSPSLSYCGVHDWRPGRLTALSNGLTVEMVETAAACLEARHFLVIDRVTEEALIRSWARFDGLMKQPRMAVSLASSYAMVGSKDIRRVLAFEIARIHKEDDSLSCWRDKRVAELLTHPAVSAKNLNVPDDPFGDGVTPGLGLGLPQTQVEFPQGFTHPLLLTPTPTPTPCSPGFAAEELESEVEKPSRKKPARKLPEDWEPTESHWARRSDGIDVAREAETFKAHAEANDRRAANWNAAFTQWLLKAKPASNVRHIGGKPAAHGLVVGEPLPAGWQQMDIPDAHIADGIYLGPPPAKTPWG